MASTGKNFREVTSVLPYLSPLAKHLFAPLPKLGQPEMTSVNVENFIFTKNADVKM